MKRRMPASVPGAPTDHQQRCCASRCPLCITPAPSASDRARSSGAFTADYPGSVVAGKYRVDKVLGVGGMGFVVAARHVQGDAKVAIKLLLPHLLEDRDAIGRFAREMFTVQKIQSEHVPRLLEVGTLDNGAPYMVMELLEGEDLGAWLSRRGPLPVDQALDFVLQACEALGEAHTRGIVHRDLKPSNLFVTRRSDGVLSLKVLDFGISKVADVEGSLASEPPVDAGAILGSPLYMSPEQARSDEVDARTDIWALGIVLYELLTGKNPFAGTTVPSIRHQVTTQMPASLRSMRQDVPADVDRIVLKCLAKKPSDRYADLAELALALADHAPARCSDSVSRVSTMSRRSTA